MRALRRAADTAIVECLSMKAGERLLIDPSRWSREAAYGNCPSGRRHGNSPDAAGNPSGVLSITLTAAPASAPAAAPAPATARAGTAYENLFSWRARIRYTQSHGKQKSLALGRPDS